MRCFENLAAIMTAETVSHWTMVSLVSVYRASPTLCAAPGSGIGSCLDCARKVHRRQKTASDRKRRSNTDK